MIGTIERQDKLKVPSKKISNHLYDDKHNGEGQVAKPPQKGLDFIQEGKVGDEDVEGESDSSEEAKEAKVKRDDDSDNKNSSDESDEDDDDESSIDMDGDNGENLY